MKTLRLTRRQTEVLLSVVNERLAGGVDDYRDAFGLSDSAAAREFSILERIGRLVMASPGRGAGHQASQRT